MLMRFKERPEKPQPGMMPPSSEDKVMHAAFKVGDTQIMASDGHCSGKPSFSGFALTLNAASDAEAEKLFNAVAQGGQVSMPMGKTFFATRFGMVADKFGVLDGAHPRSPRRRLPGARMWRCGVLTFAIGRHRLSL